jgi:hypothetical protein
MFDRYYDHHQYEMAKRAREERKANEICLLALDLVMEDVHPSFFGTLPPNPIFVLNKAYHKGLITADEHCSRTIYKHNAVGYMHFY